MWAQAVLVFATAGSMVGLAASAATAPTRESQGVPELFVRRCVACHGPQRQEGGLRLDGRSSMLRGGRNGPAVRLRDPKASLLVQRVTAPAGSGRMPPSGAPLAAEEVNSLRRWIQAGAPWSGAAGSVWWSFRPITATPVPAGPEINPIDRFIRTRLRKAGLAPAPKADQRTLIRRLSYDLLGLPPDPAEIDRFVADQAPDAYEKLVDRYLANPAFGERWARHWLDVVHFGETHGYDKDKPRPHAWPYRDYVIRAFNEDRPVARFVQEQVAGDVIYPGTTDGLVALGFLAAGPWDFIGHAELPETKIDGKVARHLDRDDMVTTTMSAFASLTVQCAQCHDHKFDPIRQEEYYGLQAIFAAVDRTEREFDADPAVATRRAELTVERTGSSQVRDRLSQRFRSELGEEWVRLERAELPLASIRPQEHGYHSAIAATDGVPKWVQVDLGATREVHSVELFGCFDDFNGIGAGFGFPRRFRIEVADREDFASGAQLVVEHSSADFPNPGTQRVAFKRTARGRFVRITATRLTPRQNDYILALSELRVLDSGGKNLALGAPVRALDSIEAPPRWRRSNLVDGLAPGLSLGATEVRSAQTDALTRRLGPSSAADWLRVMDNLDRIDQQLKSLPAPGRAYVAAVHTGSGTFTGTGPSGTPRPIHLLDRGDVRRPGKLVGPGALAAVPAPPVRVDPTAPEGTRRAALASWLTSRENPLLWRSLANRVWQYHFGRGLVETPNDFGRMGSLPTHPDLLDWLAGELRRTGSLKQLHRLIVTSQTYSQTSTASARALQVDRPNLLLSRMGRRKLEAEAVRDAILSVSGNLNRTMGGPSFQDFVIDKPEHSPHYEYHLHNAEDPTSHRRSIYRFTVRSQLQPFFAALDCADPSLLVDRRNQSLTPQQALSLLNHDLIPVMARHFARRLVVERSGLRAQIERGFQLAVGRIPSRPELDQLDEFSRRHGLPAACRLLFNLNEFHFVD